MSDDKASNLILPKNLKTLVRSNLENQQDHAVQEPTNKKFFEESNVEKEQDLAQASIDPELNVINPEQLTTG